MRIAGKLDNLKSMSALRMLNDEEVATWKLQIYDDNACVGSTVGVPAEIQDFESVTESKTVLLGNFPENEATLLCNLGRNSV